MIEPAEAGVPGTRPRRGLLRVLGAWEGAAVGIGVAIGAGIFRTPGYVAGFLDAPWKVLAVWVVGGLLVLGDCLVLAELATRLPRAGGWYAYIEEGLGRFPAFVYGWTYMLVIDPASTAALVVVLGEYLGSLLGIGPGSGRLSAIGLTTGLFVLALAGIRVGGRIQDALTYTKLALLVGVALMALFLPAAPEGTPAPAPAISGLLAFGLALQGVLWTFEGYANTTTLGEESIDPARTLPRALILGAIALGATYLLVNAAYLHVLGLEGVAASRLPGADLAERLFGGAGGRVFLLLAIFAAVGSLNGAALSAPRVAYALARSGFAPRPLTLVSRVGTPVVATWYFAIAWAAYAWLGSFEGLVSVSIFIGALCNVAVTASLFVLRKRDRGAHRPPGPPGSGSRSRGGGTASAGDLSAERAPGPDGPPVFLCPLYPALPLLMLGLWTVFAAAVLYDQGWRVGYGLLATALAAVAYFWRARHAPTVRGRGSETPVR